MEVAENYRIDANFRWLGSEIKANEELCLTVCGIERCTPDKFFGPSVREDYHVHFILHGKGTLEIGGKMLSSEEFADKINSLGVQGKSSIAFVIGGSIGLGKEVLRRSDYALSFSKMTFPHQLMRAILLEQVYRGYRIINGEPYHK